MQHAMINLYHLPPEQLFDCITAAMDHYHYDHARHTIVVEDGNHEKAGQIRLPLHVVVNDALELVSEEATVVYISIESGAAAIILMEGKDMTYHTTFSAYMTRKKQGVSQIKYLKKKGKSRAGSRVRLAESVEFFENINTTLNGLFDDYPIDRIALNCSKTLIPFFYQSRIAPPFDKGDSRLYKIPLHIPQSNHTNLYKAIKTLMAPVLEYEEGHAEVLKPLISSLSGME